MIRPNRAFCILCDCRGPRERGRVEFYDGRSEFQSEREGSNRSCRRESLRWGHSEEGELLDPDCSGGQLLIYALLVVLQSRHGGYASPPSIRTRFAPPELKGSAPSASSGADPGLPAIGKLENQIKHHRPRLVRNTQ